MPQRHWPITPCALPVRAPVRHGGHHALDLFRPHRRAVALKDATYPAHQLRLIVASPLPVASPAPRVVPDGATAQRGTPVPAGPLQPGRWNAVPGALIRQETVADRC